MLLGGVRCMTLLTGHRDEHRSRSHKAALRTSRTPLYTIDPEYSGMIAQVLPDGARTPGRLEGRRFVPMKDEPIKNAR